jgi:hypothetical protein
VMRWTTSDHRLGHLGTESHASGWTTYLIESESRHRVWGATAAIEINMGPEVTLAQWDSAAEKLVAARQPPVYVMLELEALGLLENGDYKRCIVELAVCCETFLRTSVLGRLPALPTDIWKHLEEANLNQYVTKFFPDTLTPERKVAFKPLQKELSSLLAKRNDIMHRGDATSATKDNCTRFAAVARQLLSL